MDIQQNAAMKNILVELVTNVTRAPTIRESFLDGTIHQQQDKVGEPRSSQEPDYQPGKERAREGKRNGIKGEQEDSEKKDGEEDKGKKKRKRKKNEEGEEEPKREKKRRKRRKEKKDASDPPDLVKEPSRNLQDGISNKMVGGEDPEEPNTSTTNNPDSNSADEVDEEDLEQPPSDSWNNNHLIDIIFELR